MPMAFTGFLSRKPVFNKDGSYNYRKLVRPWRKLTTKHDFVEYSLGYFFDFDTFEIESMPIMINMKITKFFRMKRGWNWQIRTWDGYTIDFKYKKKPSLAEFRRDLDWSAADLKERDKLKERQSFIEFDKLHTDQPTYQDLAYPNS